MSANFFIYVILLTNKLRTCKYKSHEKKYTAQWIRSIMGERKRRFVTLSADKLKFPILRSTKK